MKIGIDFDDITVDFSNSLLEWYNKNYNTNHKREEFTDFDFGKTWRISREKNITRVNEFHESRNNTNLLPIKDSISSLNKLSNENELIIITGRPHQFGHKVDSWISHHLGRKLKIIHAGEFHKGQASTKAEICKEMGIPILIEDAPMTAEECAKAGIKVLLFDKPWNKKVEHPNITRVFSWKEALKEIDKLKND